MASDQLALAVVPCTQLRRAAEMDVIWCNVVMAVLLLLVIFGSNGSAAQQQLQYGYYDATCPDAEEIARQALRLYFTIDPTSSAAILRVSFHDCQVQVVATFDPAAMSIPVI